MRLSNLRTLCLVAVAALSFTQVKAQDDVFFPIMGPVYVNCGDATDPAAILAITGTGPVDGVTTTNGTTSCAAGAPNMLTYSHTDNVRPRAQCMDELVLIARLWTATDACGFTLTRAQSIYIRDDIAPTITCRDITVNADLSGMSTVTAADVVMSAADDCEGIAMQTEPDITIDQSDFNLCSGEMDVIATAIDGCGNASSCTSVVTIESSCPTSLGCNSEVNVSLSYDCVAEIRPDLIIEDPSMQCPMEVRIYDIYDVLQRVTDTSTLPYVYPVLDASYVGQKWKVEAFYKDCSGTEISCWGWINVEDKIKPPVTCIPDFDVSCKDDLSTLLTSSSTAELCIDGPDIDSDIATSTYSLVLNSGSLNPWEIVTGLTSASIVNCTTGTGGGSGGGTGGSGSGTGSGTTGGGGTVSSGFTIGGLFTPLTCSMNGVFGYDVLTGVAVSTLLDGTATITIPAGSLPAGGLCFTVNTQSFGSYNPDNCDANAEVVITSDVLDENECGHAGYVALRRITYRILDTNGSSSSECSVDINFSAEPLDNIVFPGDYNHNNVGSDCVTIDEIGPGTTGRPTLNGCVLDAGNLCKLNVSYEDTRLDNDTGSIPDDCNASFKIRRKWTILDWCLGEYRQHFQEIRVVDVSPPICTTVEDITINTTVGCNANYTLPPLDPQFLSDCSDITILKVEYTQARDAFAFDASLGTIHEADELANGSYSLVNLPIGMTWVRYVLVDACGNMSQDCFFEITVQDYNPPIAVCDQYTVVSLADNGWGRLYAAAIDDGSYAPCGGDVTIQVRRPSNPCEAALLDRDDTQWGDYLQFCCAEAGETVPVMLQVSDAGGHSSSCSVNVVIQDKNNDAAVVCPTPSTIVINDCSMADPTGMFGEPVLSGECAVPAIIDVNNSNTMDDDCGVGTFTRTWIIGVNGNASAVSNCTQTISVTGQDGLTQSSFRFPQDLELDDCTDYGTDLGMFPTIGGVKVTDADLCARLAYSFDDNSFFNTEGYCVKTIRTWTIINWCIYDPVTSPDSGIWTDTQIIKVRNSTPPILTGCVQDTTVVLVGSMDDCSVFASIPAPTAVDACFGNTLPVTDFNWSVSGPGSNSSGTASGASQVLNVGTHRITWSISGGCSTEATCSYNIRVDDNGEPITYCRSNVTTVITDPGPTGQPSVEIWASDFDLGSTDACGGPLTVSFSPDDPNDTRIEFNCTQLGSHTITVYFTDSDGNQDNCLTTATIQVNGTICDTIGSINFINLEGRVLTETSQMVEDVDVSLMNMNGGAMGMQNTNIAGEFAFNGIAAFGDYRLEPEDDDDDYLNGVSTLDLIMIQRHILGLESLSSAYKVIAADANSSQDINGIDLVELRKLILGIYTELPQNESWRYVEEDFVFAQPSQPWPFNESIDLMQVVQDMNNNDFIAVKIGDVDDSALVQFNSEAVQNRGLNTLTLQSEMLSLEDKTYLVPVYFDQDVNLKGFQMSLKMKEGVKLLAVEKGAIDLFEEDYFMTEEGINISYIFPEREDVERTETLFYLTVRTEGQTEDQPYVIDNQRINSEAYNQSLETLSLISGSSTSELPVLFQNVPNPFSSQTLMEFSLPKAGHVELKLLSSDGRVLRTDKGWYEKGNHKIVWNANDMTEYGVYYYKLETDNHSITKKMIRID